jgi:hypothetical protein
VHPVMHEKRIFSHTFVVVVLLLADAVIPVDVEEEEEEEEAEEEETPEISEGEGGNGTGDPFANAMLLDKKPSFQDLGKISDKTFGAKYKKRMLEIKKKALKNRDMNIMVVSRPMSMLGQQGGHNVLVNKNRGTQKIVHQLEDKEGVLQFETGKIDGHVEICVQSLLATRQSPVRVGLNITAKSAPDENAMVDQPQYEPPLVLDPTRMLQFHTGGITDEMTKMHERVRDIVKYAEYSRDAEVGFHAHSLELNKAVRYWPAFRILILIVAGFLQVHYVLSYMKSRHYI